MPKAGSLGPEHYRQATAPIQGIPGDTWYDGLDLRIYDAINGWVLPGGTANLSNQVSVISQQVSALSQSVSSQAAALSVRIDTQSQAMSVLSQAVSVISQQISVISQQVSVLSQAVSVLSQAVSVADAALSVRVDTQSQSISVLSQQVSVISQQLSVLSQAVSVISAGLGAVQMAFVSVAQSISATGLFDISGLSVSVAGASAVYIVEGMIVYQMSVADAVGFGMSFPGMGAVGGLWRGNASVGQSVQTVASFNEDASNSIVLSVVAGTALSTLVARVEAMFQTSTAGQIIVRTRVSATTSPVTILRGSYLRTYKIG